MDLNVGTGGGSFNPRNMLSGLNTLNYNLFTDAGYTIIWGDGTGGSGRISRVNTRCFSNNGGYPHTVYGRLPGAQTTAVAGAYTSTITATLTYN